MSRHLALFDQSIAEIRRYDGVGHNLRLVATHEIGHSLGLAHTYDSDSIMFLFYQLIQPQNMLPQQVSEAFILLLSLLQILQAIVVSHSMNGSDFNLESIRVNNRRFFITV